MAIRPIANRDDSATMTTKQRPLGLLSVVAIIFFSVAGSPVGIEDAIVAGGTSLLYRCARARSCVVGCTCTLRVSHTCPVSDPCHHRVGPFYALVGLIVMPFVWCIPEALIAAELCTA